MRTILETCVLSAVVVLVLWSLSNAADVYGTTKCPDECVCRHVRVNYVTDCSYRNLTDIPYGEMSPNAYALDASGNEISEIQPFPEDLKLRRLQLAGNKISELTPRMFAGLRYIVDVDLSGNDISMVDPGSFRDSHGLITVLLRDNPLLDVEAGPFLKCRSLLYLDISRCGITKLNGDFFTEIPLLTHLDLSGNPLGDLKSSVFRPLVTLSDLILSNCNLENLEPDLLEFQTHLKLLDLSGNKLATVDWVPILDRLPRLEELRLRQVGIRRLPEDVFANNTFLRILTLSGNDLSGPDVETTLGENLRTVQSLDLSNCNITGPLTEKTFANATGLKYLNLSGNRLDSRDLSVALSPLARLDNLSLRDCYLGKLPGSTFENLTHLKHLDISRNPLANVFEDVLEPLDSLEHLDVGFSNLSELSDDTFSKTKNLKRLILSGNPLGELHVGLLTNLRHLQVLEVENCQLTGVTGDEVNDTCESLKELKMAGNPLELNEGALLPEQMRQLSVLDLSNCNLSHLPNECFQNTKNLTHLYLADNQLTAEFMYNTSFISVLSNLEYLDLSGNQLTGLPTHIADGTNLQDVKLTDNPWTCDCSLADWWSWAVKKGNVAHLMGSTFAPDDVTKTEDKRKKALLCRKDPSLTRSETEVKQTTWARYVKDCGQNKTQQPERQVQVRYSIMLEMTTRPPAKEPLIHDVVEEPTGRSLYIVAITVAVIGVVACFAVGYYIYARQNRSSRQGRFDIQLR